jgi:hypothetical protein
MQLARIVFAGALLFGAGCELPEEGDLATDEGVDQASLDDSTSYATEGLDDAIETTDYAIDEVMAPGIDVSAAMSEAVSEAAIDDEGQSSLLADDELLGSKKKWQCMYCYKKHGDKECYYGKDKEKYKAKKKAEYKCEDEHDHGCKFYDCRKSH